MYIESGRYKKVIVIGADKMSSIVDYSDRTTCIIFGDGAGGVLLEPNYEGYGVLDSILRSDGSGTQPSAYESRRIAAALFLRDRCRQRAFYLPGRPGRF